MSYSNFGENSRQQNYQQNSLKDIQSKARNRSKSVTSASQNFQSSDRERSQSKIHQMPRLNGQDGYNHQKHISQQNINGTNLAAYGPQIFTKFFAYITPTVLTGPPCPVPDRPCIPVQPVKQKSPYQLCQERNLACTIEFLIHPQTNEVLNKFNEFKKQIATSLQNLKKQRQQKVEELKKKLLNQRQQFIKNLLKRQTQKQEILIKYFRDYPKERLRYRFLLSSNRGLQRIYGLYQKYCQIFCMQSHIKDIKQPTLEQQLTTSQYRELDASSQIMDRIKKQIYGNNYIEVQKFRAGFQYFANGF